MTTGGWIFMLCSIGLVLSLIIFCYYRVLKQPPAADHRHAPPDIDTHDAGT